MTHNEPRAGSNTHTFFFRELEALELVRKRTHRRTTTTRIWSVGCSTGDEAYSLAIHLDGLRVEIVGSDIRDDALATAIAGIYDVRHLRHMNEQLKSRYFALRGEVASIEPRLRHDVRFVRHHMVKDAPLTPSSGTHWDIILCRNVLLYYEDDEMAAALANLASALAPDGILVLGATEWASSAVLAKMPRDTPLVASLEDAVVIYRRAVTQSRRPQNKTRTNATTGAPEPMPDIISDASSLRIRGDALMNAGDVKRAIDLFETGLRMTPLVADLHARLAFCHLAAGQTAKAEAGLRRSLFLAPTLWPAALVLGDLLMTEDPQAAKRYLLQAWNAVEKGSLDAQAAATAQVAPFVCAESAALDAVRVRLAWIKQRERG